MKRKNFISEYHRRISTASRSKITAGRYILKLYDKIIAGLEEGMYIFDIEKADRAIKFIENYCRHSKGRSDLLKLELWQKALISLVFGIVDKDGLRWFREVLVIIGRKNGKSLLASAIMAYVAFVDGEYGTEIYSIATKKDQAMLVYDCLVATIKADEELESYVKFRKNFLRLPESNGLVMPLPFTPESADGLNPELVVCDEIAAWRGENGIKQYEVLKSAQGSRKQPLTLSITTAGYESGGIYDELFKRGTQFLNGDTRESRILPVFYTVDDELYWDDLTELEKANPNMGVSVTRQYFVDEIAIAETSSRKKAEFLTKYCNLKQNPVTSWLPFDTINAAGCDIDIEEFRGCNAVGGFDLSMATDLTAACAVIEKGGILYIFCRFFMPEVRFKRDRNLYQINEAFVKQGILQISGENAVEYSDVVDFFEELHEKYDLTFYKIGYDRWSSREVVTKLKGKFGANNLDDVWQGWNLHPIIVKFEGLIKDGLVKICNNELLKLHFCNVALYSDIKSGNRYQPVKIATNARIDGAIAALCAVTMRSKYYEQFGVILANNED